MDQKTSSRSSDSRACAYRLCDCELSFARKAGMSSKRPSEVDVHAWMSSMALKPRCSCSGVLLPAQQGRNFLLFTRPSAAPGQEPSKSSVGSSRPAFVSSKRLNPYSSYFSCLQRSRNSRTCRCQEALQTRFRRGPQHEAQFLQRKMPGVPRKHLGRRPALRRHCLDKLCKLMSSSDSKLRL